MTHVKTTQAFGQLIGICTGLEGKFNPGRQNLQLESLSNQLEEVRQAMEHVKIAFTAYSNATNRRKQWFTSLPRLTASVMRLLEASGASSEKMDDARLYVRMMSGKGMSSRPSIPSGQAQEVKVKRSLQQLAYVSMADSFSKLIQVVSTEPLYQPREPELTSEGLTAYWQEMNRLNHQADEARTAWRNSCIARNFVMYTKPMSMHETALAVRKYVRAIYGLDSEHYAQVKSLNFSKPKN